MSIICMPFFAPNYLDCEFLLAAFFLSIVIIIIVI